MIKKVAIVENCEECPFLRINTNDEAKKYNIDYLSYCKKSKLIGTRENLWNACPLPNDASEYEDEDIGDYMCVNDKYPLKPAGQTEVSYG